MTDKDYGDLALEALALSRNAEFMTYLNGGRDRAKHGPTYSLDEIRREFKLPRRKPGSAARRK
ncbi:MAG: hypothetical protein HY023_06885 [Chloroflexi bacterium]|nr:hypothetical protein [Chloroflexota bacterium]